MIVIGIAGLVLLAIIVVELGFIYSKVGEIAEDFPSKPKT